MERLFDAARQRMEQTPNDLRTRKSGHFSETESKLPSLGRYGPPASVVSSMLALFFSPRRILDNIASYLGKSNPLSKALDPDQETCWLFDATAYRPNRRYPRRPQPFQAECTVAYFKRDTGRDESAVIGSIAERLGVGDLGDEGAEWGDTGMRKGEVKRRIGERLQPFMDEIRVGRWVQVRIGQDPSAGKDRQVRLGPGGRSGVSQNTVVVPTKAPRQAQDGDVLDITCVTPSALSHHPGRTFVADDQGWLVISDVDDTIKITMTPSAIGILRSTFVSDPTPIAGMPELYAHIQDVLGPQKPAWFYLSASPYNLYPFLHAFINDHFPAGTIMLRDASWMDLGGFLASLTQGTEAYKSSRMERIHTWLPRRKVLCVGDSTQSDPEAYGNIYRKFGGGWIKKIFIRKVSDVSEMEGTGKNDPERFEKAFRGVPKGVWTIFEEPEELWKEMEALRGT